MRPSVFRRALRRLASATVLGLLAACLTATVSSAPAQAAGGTFQQVTGFGSNPGNLSMYQYTPAGLPSGAPLVVALHGCTQTANDYYTDSGWPKYADLYGFSVIFPQTSSANNALSCFSWFDSTKDKRGVGEAASVVQMVDYAEAHTGSDPTRVFVTGLSAGAGLASDLLADYPDVFAGGSIDSGLPAQCATTEAAATSCQDSSQNLTPAQWGDKVRASDPGYSGPWPKVAIWQGSSDYEVYPVNATELRDQWTNVWGISQTASSTQSLPGGTTESIYDGPSGSPAVEMYSISGMGHGLAVDPGSGTDQCGGTGAFFLDYICSSYYTAQFWGLDGSSGGGPGGGSGSLAAPTGLAVTATTGSSVSLSWNAVSGAASYAVYRDGAEAGTSTTTSFTDNGLSSGTSYQYTVAALDSSGTAGAASAAVTATTSGFVAQCFTDNNYDQVAAGRAHQTNGTAYANGSNQNMGLWNTFVTHTLEETSAGYYVIADSGCPA
jgi:poly(hydroxyalkanoate) depolymerase family esterase